ncbi:MAG: tetratricopeptide repeat protein, partial [Myxococcota bacterium]
MSTAARPATLFHLLLAAALLACAGCGDGDGLEEIRQRHARGDYEGSISPLRELLVERPDDPEANYHYGRALVATGRGGVATFALRKAMKSTEWLVPAALQLAQASLTTADYNETVEAATLVLEREPENVTALLTRAEAHAYWRKQPELALADAKRELEIDPDAIQAFEPRILAMLWLERIDEASAAIDELGRRIEEVDSPETVRAWYCGTQAVFTQERGQLERANEIWEECLAKYPASSEVLWPAINFFDTLGRPERSIEALRTAMAAEPKTLLLRVFLADRLRQAGQAAEGEEILAVATRDEDPAVAADAWLAIGKLRQASGARERAAEPIGRAVE